MHDDEMIDVEEEKPKKEAQGDKRGRGRRAGKKNAKKERQQGPSIVQAAKVFILFLVLIFNCQAGVVEFSSKTTTNKNNMWRKKLEKKKKIKHQK